MKRIVFLSFMMVVFMSGTAFGAKRVALVIGNAAYQDRPLQTPTRDAQDMANALKQLGYSVTLVQNADHKDMLIAVNSFGKQLEQADVALFYYAGHGAQSKGRNYLLPVDKTTENEDFESDALDAERILSKMEKAVRINIVILDASHDPLAVMQGAKGAFIAYATTPGKTSSAAKGINSVFTKHILQHIRQPGLDIDAFFTRVRKGVADETRYDQIPWSSSSLLDEYAFAGSTQVESTPSAAQDSPFQDLRQQGLILTLWAHIKALFEEDEPVEEIAPVVVQAEEAPRPEPTEARLNVLGPEGAKVRILNIRPRYQQNMVLEPGKYHVEVSKPGFTTAYKWVELEKGQQLDVEIALKPGPNPPPAGDANQSETVSEPTVPSPASESDLPDTTLDNEMEKSQQENTL